MKYLLLLLISTSLWGQAPTCSGESFLIEYISPITNGKISLCGYIKHGSTVKHGEEWHYSSKGEILKKINYIHGTSAQLPVEDKKPQSDETAIMKTIGEMLQILSLKKSTPGKGIFKIQRCDPNPSDWVKGAIMKTPVAKTYDFAELCDVSGFFTANFATEFPVKFNLRHLQDFTATEMTVKMYLKKVSQGYKYSFDVLAGSITSTTRSAHFTVQYEVEIDPVTGETLAGSQTGKVNLIKINGKEVSASSAILFEN